VLQHHVPLAVSSGQATPAGVLPADQNMRLSIVLPLRNQAELTSLLGRLYDPSSPDYRHFLSVDQFTEQFGPTAADFQAVVAFAQANGLQVTDTPANRLIVPVSGSVAQINQAFNLTLKVYQHPTEHRTFYSPDREPSLSLGVRVAHIAGLNNFSLPRPMLKQAANGQAVADVTGSGPGGSYLGSDMRAAYYGGTTLTGTGQAVGILEFGGYNLNDVNATFTNAGQSYTVPINNVLLDGATGAAEGDDGEQVLDIVQAIGMAPGLSQVRVYIGVGNDDAIILNSMATENIAKQLSISWSWLADDVATDDAFFQEFAAQGQSIFAASGDEGAFDAAIDPYFYPGEDAYVTAVGGTHLTTNGAGGAWASETAWNSEGYGSGGGVSPDAIAIPSWQTGVASTANGGSTSLRNVPDVAMEGDFDNYNCSLATGCGGGAAGTSFAAPRWAGFLALVNQQAVEAGTAPMGGVGAINPQIYAIGAGANYPSDLHDITVGTNDTEGQPVSFNAVSGYDLVTGWGSASGQSLIDALAGPQVPGYWLTSSSSNLSIAQGASASTTITVTDAGGFSGSVNLAVTSTLPTGVTAAWGTNPTTGTSVLTLTASSTAPGATATVTITGTSGTMTVSTNLEVTVHPPSFTLSTSPAVLTVNQGASGTSTVTVNPQYGFSGSVSLAVTSALPTGVTASWGTNPTSGTSVLTLTASSTAPAATVSVTITGTSGSLTASTTMTLIVYAPYFSLSASAVNLGLGTSGTSYVYVYDEDGFSGSVNLAVTGLPAGVTASFAPNPTTGLSQLTLTASSTASTGIATLTITGTSGSLTATTTLALGVYAPTFTLSAYGTTVGQGTSTTTYVYVNPQYGFTGNVNLAVSGLPSGVTASLSPNPTTGTSTLTLTASSTATLGNSTLTITGTSGSLAVSTTLTLGVYVPTFTMSANNMSIGQGSSITNYVYITPQYGFTGSVNLSVTGLPSGVTASFAPNPLSGGSSQLTLTASNTASLGNATLTVTGPPAPSPSPPPSPSVSMRPASPFRIIPAAPLARGVPSQTTSISLRSTDSAAASIWL
jgi:subtilase family serine protease